MSTIYCKNGHPCENPNPEFNMAGGYCHYCQESGRWSMQAPATAPVEIATLRDQFAMASLNAARKTAWIITLDRNSNPPTIQGLPLSSHVARVAYEFADAMLEARKR